MRIMFITNIMSNGGSERVISVLSQELLYAGHSIAVLLYKRTPNEYPLLNEVQLHCLSDSESTSKLKNPILRKTTNIYKIRKIIKQFNPDCVIPFLDTAMYETFVASRFLNTHFIATLRNKPAKETGLRYLLRKKVYESCSAIFLQTEDQKNFLMPKDREKSFVLPNPVNTAVIHVGESMDRPPQIKHFITTGRLNAQKNHALLIDAMVDVHKAHPEVSLAIYGVGELENELQDRVIRYDALNYIHLAGRTNAIPTVLADADAFVFSSNFEGMPSSLMEAMAAGLPCVSTDCPTGPRELIGNNERGLLVPVEDKIALTEAIIYLIENPNKAKELGKKAHVFVKKRYMPNIISRKFIDNCKRIICE